MKKGTFATGVVVAVAAAAGGYYLLRPKPTPQEVKSPVDVQYEELCIQLNDLNAKAQLEGANIDSLTLVLEDLKWSPVKDGGQYEVQKRNLYLDAKKNVAMTFRQALLDRGQEITNPHLDDVESINE